MPVIPTSSLDDCRCVRIRVRGAVQGVGFRPFVHNLAIRHSLAGFVLNDSEGVLAEVEGRNLDYFLAELQKEKPALARILSLEVTSIPSEGRGEFVIRNSIVSDFARTSIVPDAAPCSSCLSEVFDPQSRFYLYPFTTCTQCGPRFTILEALPYDRKNTAMAKFSLCSACAGDYQDPGGRRFHAEAIGCPACGPQLSHGVKDIANAIRRGDIVALKGIGGYHLLCDAKSEAAVARLRVVKGRPAKPFAVMAANIASVQEIATLTAGEKVLLDHIANPIVLVRGGKTLAPSVAPAMDRVGVMLPASPLYYLLFHSLAGEPEGLDWLEHAQPTVLVATSGNGEQQPPVIDNVEAMSLLAGIAELVVTHDRPIFVRADDSVMTVIDDGPAVIRRSRGFVPEPIDLGTDGPAVLAAGAHLKATICITRGREAFISQHLGDLGSAEVSRFYAITAQQMLAHLGASPEVVVCDLHPDYRSTRFAQSTGFPLLQVQHHAAHVAAVVAEHHLTGAVLGVALDGYGYGDDGGAWGGELILLEGMDWRRLGYLAPLGMPGGDRAAHEPWRMGIAALTALGRGDEAASRFPGIALAKSVSGFPVPIRQISTTSMGRLFDAAAALLGVCMVQSFEGQAAMQLEALVRTPRYLPDGYRIIDDVLDFKPLLACLRASGLRATEGAELFHGTLINGLGEWIGRAAAQHGCVNVALGGGCFSNRVMTEGLLSVLRALGLCPWIPRAVPANDGGLSLGQAALARAFLMPATQQSSIASRS